VEVEFTNRGFGIIKFKDHNQRECSLQQSSAIGDREDSYDRPGSSFVWLGVDKAPEELGYRMHLDHKQVEELINRLSNWLETGSFYYEEETIEPRH
jgi:hypothetical protein